MVVGKAESSMAGTVPERSRNARWMLGYLRRTLMRMAMASVVWLSAVTDATMFCCSREASGAGTVDGDGGGAEEWGVGAGMERLAISASAAASACSAAAMSRAAVAVAAVRAETRSDSPSIGREGSSCDDRLRDRREARRSWAAVAAAQAAAASARARSAAAVDSAARARESDVGDPEAVGCRGRSGDRGAGSELTWSRSGDPSAPAGPNRRPEEPPRQPGSRARAWSVRQMQPETVTCMWSRVPRALDRTPPAARPSSVVSTMRWRETEWYGTV